ncbi:unnamed protein product [Cylindrotheca closterium]|uniref:Uncharacterized protein n=1 Tax=Cylindrotheca closterium TaxID=2856 RepID=A0AAD2G6R7_9STRA|nr:unnamed protein product [Cylindrotheca closterium]
MSDDDYSFSDGEDARSLAEFDALFFESIGEGTRLSELHDLKHVQGEDLHIVLPENFDGLRFAGFVNPHDKEYKRVLYLLQSNRRWRRILLSDDGAASASPEFLSLVVLALTKTNDVTLMECPLDQNFFACLNSGMHTLKQLIMMGGSDPISFEAAAMFANGLTISSSLEVLEINHACRFEHGAGLKVVEGIGRNKSLKSLTIAESNLSPVAMTSILRAVSEGKVPKLSMLNVKLKHESSCTQLLTILISSDTCHLEKLTINEDDYDISPSMFRTDGIPTGTVNRMLEKLEICSGRFDDSYLASLLPRMPNLLDLDLKSCNLSDITPIINHLRHPSTIIRSIGLSANFDIGLDQAEYFASCLDDMQSLTDANICLDLSYCCENDDLERFQKVVRILSNCWNLESFEFHSMSDGVEKLVKESNLNLTFAINCGWRRELCYKQRYRESSAPPSKLLPLIIARALRKTTSSTLRADVVLSLFRERICDIIQN